MPPAVDPGVGHALAWLAAHADLSVREQMGPRYGIHTDRALGVAMKDMKVLAKDLGRDHDLAAALWADGGYEARTVAALVDDAELVTVEQMDRWVAEFDNWAICDTVCFNLFDRAADPWGRVDAWFADDREFVRRAAFALIWALALHDRTADDGRFEHALALIEEGATDDRPLVNKAVIMALRAVAKKRLTVADATTEVGLRLAASGDPNASRAGRAVLKDLGSAV